MDKRLIVNKLQNNSKYVKQKAAKSSKKQQKAAKSSKKQQKAAKSSRKLPLN
jgi:hypothetical protein